MSTELKSSPTHGTGVLTAQTIIDWIAGWAEPRGLKVPSNLDTTFSDAGFDSLHSVELAFFLEEKLGAKIDDTLLYDRPTFTSLAEHLVGLFQPVGAPGSGASSTRLASDAAADW
jgi:acyl carrier protein